MELVLQESRITKKFRKKENKKHPYKNTRRKIKCQKV